MSEHLIKEEISNHQHDIATACWDGLEEAKSFNQVVAASYIMRLRVVLHLAYAIDAAIRDKSIMEFRGQIKKALNLIKDYEEHKP